MTKQKKVFKMELIYLIAHLIITLAIVGGYIFSTLDGAPDETLKMALLAVVGFWFGAIGKESAINKVKEGESK